MSKNILITGGSGMIGMQLSSLLSDKGYSVAHLTRKKQSTHSYKQFEWDVDKDYLEDGALEFADMIIHLAGAGVADKRWTSKRKQVIIDSRTETAGLLYRKLKADDKHSISKFISASAIGYYGMDTGDVLLDEEYQAGNDFLADVVVKWEAAADQFNDFDIPVSKLRVGVVLTKEGGALPQLAMPIKFGVGAALGSGKQMMSWVHVDDICQMFLALVEKDHTGIFNAVAPQPVSNKAMTKAVAKALGKPLWLPNVPAFVMKVMLGEMAGIVLGGNNVSCAKLEKSGYQFKFNSIEEALKDIYS